MSPGHGRTSSAAQIPTASMADIAFLLLIFFLVTTVFDEERGLPLVLPEADLPVTVSPHNLLHLRVLEDGSVEVQRGEGPVRQRVTAADLAALWRAEAAHNPALIASLRTEPAAPYGAMVGALDALQEAGATRISLGVWER